VAGDNDVASAAGVWVRSAATGVLSSSS